MDSGMTDMVEDKKPSCR